MNPLLKNMQCILCGEEYAIDDYFLGCPKCLETGTPASLTFQYEGKYSTSGKKSMQKYASRLPYSSFPTLGEGNTPVISLDRLANDLNLTSVLVKNEHQNPTGSHKDRMNPLIVARAMDLGKKGVAAASSGNEGVSLAAYAALAGLECTILSTEAIEPGWKSAILAAGAQLIIVDKAEERWVQLAELVKTGDWYPATNFISPPVGSNCFGLQGYKTIAYELFDDLGTQLPDYIFVPVARGDLLYGIYEGFCDLRDSGYISRIPRFVAVEPLPRLEQVLEHGATCQDCFPGDYGLTESIGGNTATVQSKNALVGSEGMAVSIGQEEVVPAIHELSTYGLYLESSSALALSGLKKLCNQGRIPCEATVMLVSTSGGSKNGPGIIDMILEQTSKRQQRISVH